MTQGELEKIPKRIEQEMNRLQTRIMEDLVRRIRINGFSTASADWQFTRLQQLGMSEKQIRDWVRECLGATDEEIEKIFSDDVYEDYMGHRRGYQLQGRQQIPFEENQELQQLIGAVQEQTKGQLERITGSMGFVKQAPSGSMQAMPLTRYYQKTLDDAMYDIHSGSFDYGTVLTRAVDDMTKSGLRWIDFESGFHNRVNVAARRAVMTGFRQVQGKINEQVARDLQTDSYEVTVHIGARPSHQPWEGKVWTMEQLHSVCGLGTVTGLHGANCYHDYNAFIPGVSVRTYTDEQLEQIHEEENTPKTFNGKEYTTYEALQRQRQLETRARKYREDVHLLEEGGGSEDGIIAKKCRYQKTMQEYRAFSKKMDLPMQKERIYQDGLKVKMELTQAEREIVKTNEVLKKTKIEAPAKPDIIVPDTTECTYRTEAEYSALAKAHAKNTDKADKKQIAKHTKPDGSPGGYVATHNYQTINRALMDGDFESLCDDDKATVIAMRKAIASNTLDQDSVLTRYVNAGYLSSKFGIYDSHGKPLGDMELMYRKGVMHAVAETAKTKIGTAISSDAFVSTSMVKDKNIMKNKSVRMTISAVKGTHCYVPTNRRESELIFGDNTSLFITDVSVALDGKLEIFAVLLE